MVVGVRERLKSIYLAGLIYRRDAEVAGKYNTAYKKMHVPFIDF
jgi:hypothetical protein